MIIVYKINAVSKIKIYRKVFWLIANSGSFWLGLYNFLSIAFTLTNVISN